MAHQRTRRPTLSQAPAQSFEAAHEPQALAPSLHHSFGAVPLHGLPIQPKLTVGAADDPYEREADRVAEQVMATPAAQAEEQPAISALGAGGLRTSRAGAAGSFEAGAAFEQQLGSAGGGSPLPAETRAFMEPRFGADFSGVRIHTGGESAQLNRQVSAQAFTHGSDIYMGEGHTNIGSGDGQRLLAHELTHVVQQTGGVARKPVVQRKLGGALANVTHNAFWGLLKKEGIKIPFGVSEKLYGEVGQKEQEYTSIHDVIAAFADKDPYKTHLSGQSNAQEATQPSLDEQNRPTDENALINLQTTTPETIIDQMFRALPPFASGLTLASPDVITRVFMLFGERPDAVLTPAEIRAAINQAGNWQGAKVPTESQKPNIKAGTTCKVQSTVATNDGADLTISKVYRNPQRYDAADPAQDGFVFFSERMPLDLTRRMMACYDRYGMRKDVTQTWINRGMENHPFYGTSRAGGGAGQGGDKGTYEISFNPALKIHALHDPEGNETLSSLETTYVSDTGDLSTATVIAFGKAFNPASEITFVRPLRPGQNGLTTVTIEKVA